MIATEKIVCFRGGKQGCGGPHEEESVRRWGGRKLGERLHCGSYKEGTSRLKLASLNHL